ncbi:MAG: hypothetical protein HY319_16920 [Armatimonadetes bacterium]|nr:hypothetical protein [Armatimonadota bacterium]
MHRSCRASLAVRAGWSLDKACAETKGEQLPGVAAQAPQAVSRAARWTRGPRRFLASTSVAQMMPLRFIARAPTTL